MKRRKINKSKKSEMTEHMKMTNYLNSKKKLKQEDNLLQIEINPIKVIY